MPGILKKLKKTFLSAKFLGFCLMGVINTFNAAFISWASHFKMQENIAAVVGYVASLAVNYVLNSFFVFKSRLNFKKLLRFLISYVPNFIIYFLVSFLTINVLHMNQFWATVLAVAVGGPVTFVMIKLYAFGNKEN